MAIYRFTMQKTMRSIGTWVMIALPFVVLLFILSLNVFGKIDPKYITNEDITKEHIKNLRGIWIWVMRILIFIFLSIFISLKAINIFRDEIDEGTLLIIVSKPVSRWKIFWEKWLVLETNVLILLTIALWGPTFIIAMTNVLPSGALKWLFTNVALTWVFALFIQFLITSLAVMISLVMGAKGTVALFSALGMVGFIAWIPSFVWIGFNPIGTNSINFNNDGGLSEYQNYQQALKDYPQLFGETYKNFQNNDGNALYNQFDEYYKSILKDDDKNSSYNKLFDEPIASRPEIIKDGDYKFNSSSKKLKIDFENYISKLLLKREWLVDYQVLNGNIINPDPLKESIKKNKLKQKKIIRNLDFDKFVNSRYFKTIFGNYNKITFQINLKLNKVNDQKYNINQFANSTLYFWENDVAKNLIKSVNPKNSYYHLDYDLNKFAIFLNEYNQEIDKCIQESLKDKNDVIFDSQHLQDFQDLGFKISDDKSNNDYLLFSYSYDDIKNNQILKRQLMKKLLTAIPLQDFDQTTWQSNEILELKNNLLNYVPYVTKTSGKLFGKNFITPIKNAFDKSAILAEKYYNAIEYFKKQNADIKDIKFDTETLGASYWNFKVSKLALQVEDTTKGANKISKSNIFSVFNFFEHIEKMFKLVVEPNQSWGIIGMQTPNEVSLKYHYADDNAFGPLWEKSSYRGDKEVLLTIYILITIISTFSAFALLKFKNLT